MATSLILAALIALTPVGLKQDGYEWYGGWRTTCSGDSYQMFRAIDESPQGVGTMNRINRLRARMTPAQVRAAMRPIRPERDFTRQAQIMTFSGAIPSGLEYRAVLEFIDGRLSTARVYADVEPIGVSGIDSNGQCDWYKLY